MYRRTFIEIDTKNLHKNVETIIQKYPTYEYYFGVVKGNSYGHGYEVIPTLEQAGVNYFSVSSLEEALSVRKFTELPILCLQPLHASEASVCVENNITLTISNLELAKNIASQNFSKQIKIHIKVDSGFNRLGFNDKVELENAIKILRENSNVELEGIYSHFATSGVFDKNWDKQLKKFTQLTANLDLDKLKIRHLGRGLTLINHAQIPFCNGIRLGLIMYGLEQSPSRKVNGFINKLKLWRRTLLAQMQNVSPTTTDIHLPLSTCLSLKSEVIEIKKAQVGETLGYGASYKFEKDAHVAIVPVGYADGFSKRNKNGFVFINGKKCQMVGEINMGLMTVLVPENVQVGDEVELFGQNIKIQEVARRTGSSTYEVMCALQNNLPRKLL
jgi:alanine racemase